MSRKPSRATARTLLLSLMGLGIVSVIHAEQGKIPITTQSEKARELFVKGRQLSDGLRATDARQLFIGAVAEDEQFALAHWGLAVTAPTNAQFFSSLKNAVAFAGQASEGERLVIQALDAQVRDDPATQKALLDKLAQLYPKDERAQEFLGNYHFFFGRQEAKQAVEHYTKATKINPGYAPVYNSLGYAHRFLGEYAKAEAAFGKYIELIPEEPNPYDSLAELLMKMGRYEESIAKYKEALDRDPNFWASYVGIGNNQIFLGQPEEARKTLAKLHSRARDIGEKRQALLWTAVSHLHEGNSKQAIAVLEKRLALVEETGDHATMAGDLNRLGTVLLEAGDTQAALAKYRQAVTVREKADVPEEVKSSGRRQLLYHEARVALKEGDLETASAKAADYKKSVATKQIPGEIRNTHELAGMIALAREDYTGALSALELADQLDPRVLYARALALEGMGATEAARKACEKVAGFNELSVDYAYVRGAAQAMLARGVTSIE